MLFEDVFVIRMVLLYNYIKAEDNREEIHDILSICLDFCGQKNPYCSPIINKCHEKRYEPMEI